MDSNHFILNRFFSQATFAEVMERVDSSTYVSVINRFINDTEHLRNKEIIQHIYRYIAKRYRNEYFYKNTLLNKLLLGRHSVRTTTALSELSIDKSKADFVLINGNATVYEIKTELDSLNRLESQLNNYYKAFDHVCVVSCESNYKKLAEMLKGTNVGIYILTARNTLSLRAEPRSDRSKLSHKSMFKILRRGEYENILMTRFGELPATRPVTYYRECFEKFRTLPIDEAYRYQLTELKQRRLQELEEFNKVPYELKFLMYFSKWKSRDYRKLDDFLEKTFGG